MSLDDKFYPDDGSLLTKLDNALIKGAGLIGKAYQHTTGNDYKVLIRKLFKISSEIYKPFDKKFSDILNQKSEFLTTMSPIEDKLLSERITSYPNFSRDIRLTSMLGKVLGYSATIGACAIGHYVAAILMVGATQGGFSFVLPTYMSLADVPEPPKKTVWQKAKDKVNDALDKLPTWEPRPELQPVPIPVRHNYENNTYSK